MAAAASLHILRIVLSCRQIAAEVTAPASVAIVAMASSSEQEFVAEQRTRLNRFPRCRTFWDARVASRVGDKLALRLHEAGVPSLQLHIGEGLSWPVHHRRPAASLFDSLERAGILVYGAEPLMEDARTGASSIICSYD
ncbi:unnamed protein product [Spirodela intermedia]|uniref:Uncharacterized protein n=1 Tax=Spirodela intermedia TaxID=51605 RepID=A0A7I8KSZ2_SPIIN|nr:unnamed protein product [Spirodela intermedia]